MSGEKTREGPWELFKFFQDPCEIQEVQLAGRFGGFFKSYTHCLSGGMVHVTLQSYIKMEVI